MKIFIKSRGYFYKTLQTLIKGFKHFHQKVRSFLSKILMFISSVSGVFIKGFRHFYQWIQTLLSMDSDIFIRKFSHFYRMLHFYQASQIFLSKASDTFIKGFRHSHKKKIQWFLFELLSNDICIEAFRYYINEKFRYFDRKLQPTFLSKASHNLINHFGNFYQNPQPRSDIFSPLTPWGNEDQTTQPTTS